MELRRDAPSQLTPASANSPCPGSPEGSALQDPQMSVLEFERGMEYKTTMALGSLPVGECDCSSCALGSFFYPIANSKCFSESW